MRKKLHNYSIICRQLCLIVFGISLFTSGCQNAPENNKDSLTLKILNTANEPVPYAVISISDSNQINKVASFQNINAFIEETNQPLALQKILSKEGSLKEILIGCEFAPGETKHVVIRDEKLADTIRFPKRTQAEISVKEGGEWEIVTKSNGNQQYEYKGGTFKNVEKLKVPEQHTDHSFYIRYEGPGWESDLVGYRFYLDWRNATDIFGKKVTEPVLQDVGQDGFDSYHEPAGWGMDILKVGSSLGIGSIAYWDGDAAQRVAETDSVSCYILENGIIRSKIKTKYYGWVIGDTKTDLKSKLSITAGTHLTKHAVYLSNPLDNLCTGIVKHDGAEVFLSEIEGPWKYMATWGKQSLNNDMLGMVIFFQSSDLIDITEDEHSHVVVLNPQDQKLKYYFGAVWEKDPSQIKTKEAFINYLNTEQDKLNQPVKIVE